MPLTSRGLQMWKSHYPMSSCGSVVRVKLNSFVPYSQLSWNKRDVHCVLQMFAMCLDLSFVGSWDGQAVPDWVVCWPVWWFVCCCACWLTSTGNLALSLFHGLFTLQHSSLFLTLLTTLKQDWYILWTYIWYFMTKQTDNSTKQLTCTAAFIPLNCPLWAREHCRISPPHFLVECRMMRLNQASFVLLCFVLFAFFWVVFSFCSVSVFNLSPVMYLAACTNMNGTL